MPGIWDQLVQAAKALVASGEVDKPMPQFSGPPANITNHPEMEHPSGRGTPYQYAVDPRGVLVPEGVQEATEWLDVPDDPSAKALWLEKEHARVAAQRGRSKVRQTYQPEFKPNALSQDK
jgi:hypothetical protein